MYRSVPYLKLSPVLRLDGLSGHGFYKLALMLRSFLDFFDEHNPIFIYNFNMVSHQYEKNYIKYDLIIMNFPLENIFL